MRILFVALCACLLLCSTARADFVQVIADGSIAGGGFQNQGSFDASMLGVGETLLVDLEVSRQENSGGDSWFSVGVNSPGFNGVTNGDFGALNRTRTDVGTAHQTFDTTAGDLAHGNDTADATSRMRLQITNNGFNGVADYLYQVDNDNDGSFDVGNRGQFNLGAEPLDVSFSALGKAHDYTTIVGEPVKVITDLWNTGVDNAGLALGDNVADPHYTLTVDPSGLGAATVTDDNFPIPPWLANDGDSRWIGPADGGDANGPAGLYVYETSFTLPDNANLRSVHITGAWATDNPGVDIMLNGTSVGAGQVSSGFTSFTPFKIDSSAPFQTGVNTLSFSLNNAGGPTGLRVDDIVGTYRIIPEPSTFALGGLLSVGLLARRRRS